MPTPAQRRRQQEVGGKIGAVGWERPQSGALGQQRQQKQLVAAKVGSVDWGSDASQQPAEVQRFQRMHQEAERGAGPARSSTDERSGYRDSGVFSASAAAPPSSSTSASRQREKPGAPDARQAFLAESHLEQMLEAYEVLSHPKRPDIDKFLKTALSKCVMFEGLAPEQLQRMVDAMEPCHLKPREVVMRMGELCDYMFVVHSGRVMLQQGASSRHQVQVGPGGSFGESALMHNRAVDATAVASGMVQLFRLHRLAFKLLQLERGLQDGSMRLRFLKQVQIFNRMNLDGHDYDALCDAMEPVEFADGQIIIKEGDCDRVFYVLTHGEVAVHSAGAHVKNFAPGDYFGEMSLLTGAPRNHNVRHAGVHGARAGQGHGLRKARGRVGARRLPA